MLKARTDVVGSLLRPSSLLEARRRHRDNELAPTEFKRIEDQAVDGAIALQEQVGLDVLTDGEMRRESFQSQVTESVEGFAPHTIDAFLWGNWRGAETVGNRSIERPPDLGLNGRLRRKRHLSVEEFVYARARTSVPVKVTLPSPSLFANFWQSEQPGNPYPDLDEFLEDMTLILREEVEELVRLGARYIQIDAPHYPLLIDPETRAFYERVGWNISQWLERGIALDNRAMIDLPDVTYAFHLCRGNQASRWLVEGSYGPIAEQIFNGVRAQRLMLEYDDERSGDFQPLRHVPGDKIAVLGLVTTKSGRRETVTELARRIDQASKFIPLDRLAISPQCGFATSVLGNALTFDDQRYKLEILAATARQVWG